MIAHVVLFRPRAQLDAEGRRALEQAFAQAASEITCIRRASVGRRVMHGRSYERLMQEDYTYAAILEFDDLDGLRAYLDHPAHEKLGTQFFASFERALIYDFDMAEGTTALDVLKKARPP